MLVEFKHPTGLIITVETTNVPDVIPEIQCENKTVLDSLNFNMGSFLGSYLFATEIEGAKEQYQELCTVSNVSDSIYSVQTNMDRYLQDFLIPDMTLMGYSFRIVKP